MLNLDTLQTARLIQEQAYPDQLERSRLLRQAREGKPRSHPAPVVMLGAMLARLGAWLQGRPQLPRPESICPVCEQPCPAMLA